MLPAVPGADDEPQSTPAGEQLRLFPPGSHLRPTSSASPEYSPEPSWPSSVGALEAAGIDVLGTIDICSVSEPEPPPVYVVVIVTSRVVDCASAPGPAPGSVALV